MKKFHAELQEPVRVGMEATGKAHWFARMLAQLGQELWVGDAAEIQTAMLRKPKTDSRYARHILDLLLQDRLLLISSPPSVVYGSSCGIATIANFGEESITSLAMGQGT